MTKIQRQINNDKEAWEIRRELERRFVNGHREMCEFLGKPCTVYYGEWGFLFEKMNLRTLRRELRKTKLLAAISAR